MMHGLVRGLLALGLAAAAVAPARAELDPKAITALLPAQIPWGPVSAAGNQQAVLVGDPAGPGFYAVMVRWLPGHMSRPHSHPNDRFITVLSGTWWMGSGPAFSPETTVPVPAGGFVTHHARGVHYDGAKAEPAVLLIVGEGPGTSAPAAAPAR
ncbi:cupin domain-containing protein [Paeniroseomonas aquatica]|uniref:Cupin domain-containing protein n=1 Tax=Paeniroseomonas aquatica TaxID=373043 RepID=A0ABT8AD58_9PROT|nr:cupin domain-containing protein [Paeniroseomonas aquatica]MDN3567724.1 cupin domain-containing protein [Paeniroseomonas aquatica]